MEKNNDQGGLQKSTFLERLAEKVGMSAKVTRIFGEPVERDGVTVIPVSKVMYGFGGGAGTKANEEGSGGGGGVNISPLGYIEINQGATRFRTILDPQIIMGMVAIGGFFALLTVRSISKILHPKKK